MEELRKTTKSNLVACLQELVSGDGTVTAASAKILDGAALVNLINPRISYTFEEYAEMEFLPYIRYVIFLYEIFSSCIEK